VYPERADKAPVVVVIHEIFGLNDWARAVADQLAADGFIAIAPDFLSGKAPDGKGGTAAIGADNARAAMGKLDPAEIIRRLDGAAAYATALPASTGRYGVVGFCWGGAISFAWATQQSALGAAVVYYGTSPATETLKTVKAPVLGLYGGSDARVNATVGAAKAEMDRLGKRYEIETYEGAGHAFLRQQTGQNGANAAASSAAWPRTLKFLKELLEGKQVSLSAGETAIAAAFAGSGECVDACVM
jgi:carboxymethylenebutenolidase